MLVEKENCSSGSKFARKSILNVHKLIHSGEMLFECTICGGKFKRKTVLKRYMLTHSCEKPSECNVCNSRLHREKI